MERKYIQVRPSAEKLNPDDIVKHISSLHKLTDHDKSGSLRNKINPLRDSSEDVPKFEFLVINQGNDTPVDLLYRTEENQMNVLKNKLTTAYPASFDVEIVTIDILEKVIPPEKYTPQDFVKKVENGELLFDEESKGSVKDITSGGDNVITDEEREETRKEQREQIDSDTAVNDANDAQPGSELNLVQASETTKEQQQEPEDAVTNTGTEQKIDPEHIDGYDMLKEIDAGLLDVVDLPDEVNSTELETAVDGPTWTNDGDILARPTLEHGEPIATRWYGKGERKKDWMTTIKMFSKIFNDDDDEIQSDAPLATLIQHLSDSDIPIAFQVSFKRIEDWTKQAEKRKDDLHLNRDTLGEKIKYEVGQIVHEPSQERRKERRRDPMDDIGESTDSNTESPITGEVGKRQKLIDNKIPKRTFRTNIRAVSVANDEVSKHNVKTTMNELASVLDHLDGFYYGLEPEILTDSEEDSRFRKTKEATEEFHRLINNEMITGSGKKRPDIILNADELANFITVPSGGNLTVGGKRGIRAEAKTRDPLPKPDPDIMRQFHKPGMRIGYALDKEAEVEPVPTQVPPAHLTKHYGRFATTGGGKSKALINDILSLYENTEGPTILIDPKGDGMAENYMRTHYERFGEEDFKENVIHFPVPDVIPGFAFFNIESDVENRMQGNTSRSREDVRRDVVQNKADAYQEILKLVMGLESYQDSKVAPIMISSFIKILFDEEYVKDKQRAAERGEGDGKLSDRPNQNVFSHTHLEELSRHVKDGRTPHPVSEANRPIQETVEEQIQGDENTFDVIMNSVFNRINYIREDQHLRKLFNNTEPDFDFQDHLDSNKVILFDLGDLRDDASMVMTGVILTELWDALQSANQTTCTKGHEDIEECRQKAHRNGLNKYDPPCREPWPDDHLVNMIIDEAASVTASRILTKMLEQGRSFKLSVGLSMQFPEQMKSAGERVYKNVLNNMATKLIGKITLDEEIAKAMAHEGMDVETFNNRISSLPRGEWIAQLPSPSFMETGPEPFSLQPLPIPAGHKESQYVLNEEAEQRFQHLLNNVVRKKTRNEFGVTAQRTTDQTGSAEQRRNGGGKQAQQATNGGGNAVGAGGGVSENGGNGVETNGSGRSEESTGDGDDDITMGDVTLPDNVVNNGDEGNESTGEREEVSGSEMSVNPGGNNESEVSDTQSEARTNGEGGVKSNGDVESESGVESNGSSSTEVTGLQAISGTDTKQSGTPDHVRLTDNMIYECKFCDEEYFKDEKQQAINCCKNKIIALAEENGFPYTLTSQQHNPDYITSTERWHDFNGDVRSSYTVISKAEFAAQQRNPELADSEITRIRELAEVTERFNEETVAGLLSAVSAVIPPEYHHCLETIIEWYIDGLKENEEKVEDVTPSEANITRLIYTSRPSDVHVDVEALLGWVLDSVDNDIITRWENNDCDPAFKRYYSGWVSIDEQNLARPGKYNPTYGTRYGLGEPVSTSPVDPIVFKYDESITGDGESSDDSDTSDSIEEPATPDISDEHLAENNVTRDEAKFMRSVVKAMNNDLVGYSLLDSMNPIKKKYDIDEEKLIENGFVKKHAGANNRVYYTITDDGQDVCKMKKQHGYTIGDLGDDTPHRIGIELAKAYYNSLDEVSHVDLSAKVDGGEMDLRVFDTDNKEMVNVEVEAGGVSADRDDSSDEKSSLNDYEEVRRDYKAMKKATGDAVWVGRNNETCGKILRALRSGDDDEVPFTIQKATIEAIENGDAKISTLNKRLNEIDDDGISQMLTYKTLRQKLNN